MCKTALKDRHTGKPRLVFWVFFFFFNRPSDLKSTSKFVKLPMPRGHMGWSAPHSPCLSLAPAAGPLPPRLHPRSPPPRARVRGDDRQPSAPPGGRQGLHVNPAQRVPRPAQHCQRPDRPRRAHRRAGLRALPREVLPGGRAQLLQVAAGGPPEALRPVSAFAETSFAALCPSGRGAGRTAPRPGGWGGSGHSRCFDFGDGGKAEPVHRRVT